jgi:hypothetical protein
MAKITSEKAKRLFYRRASWTDQNKETLEKLLKISHDKFKSTFDRKFEGLYGNEIKCARYVIKKNVGLFFQIASSIPGRATSAIDKPSSATINSDITEINAPEGKDFLDGDVFLLVQGNNVILIQSGARENVALYYLAQMLKKNSYEKEAMSLSFEKIAKEDKVKMIHDQGVKSVELNSSLFEASLRHFEQKKDQEKKETKIFDVMGNIAKTLKQVFSEDPKLKEINELENVNIKLSISFDGKEAMKKEHKNQVGFGMLGRSRLEKTSKKILEEYLEENVDGFTIITQNNNRITSNEIVISDIYRIKTFGNSLVANDAFEKLENYLKQLDNQAILTR